MGQRHADLAAEVLMTPPAELQLDDALELIGTGPFHWRLITVCGAGWLGSRCNHSEAALRAAMRPSEESAHLCLSGWRLENVSGTPLVFAPCRKVSAEHQQWTTAAAKGGGGGVRIAVAAAPDMCVTAAPLHVGE